MWSDLLSSLNLPVNDVPALFSNYNNIPQVEEIGSSHLSKNTSINY
jgi:hypothetical protein